MSILIKEKVNNLELNSDMIDSRHMDLEFFSLLTL
jgi:hypothetical protein